LTLSQAAADLGLPCDPSSQDWGIEHANATRLKDFVAYYRQHAAMFEDDALERELGWLLLESANDALLLDFSDEETIREVLNVVVARQGAEVTGEVIDSWRSADLPGEEGWMDGAEAYPLARLLRQVLTSAVL